jgi:hypothetical protein
MSERAADGVDERGTHAAPPPRFVAFHQYDHELGTKPRVFEHTRVAPRLAAHARELAHELFGGQAFAAAHVRVADAHWERSDCKHSIGGVAVHSVSCGDPARVINGTAMARELLYALRQMGSKPEAEAARGADDADDADAAADAGDMPTPTHVYLASNLGCADTRVALLRAALAAQHVQLVCAQERLRERTAADNFVASLVEQQLCADATGFVGSKYSTWTDTVRGMRAHARRGARTFSFEELWADGVR